MYRVFNMGVGFAVIVSSKNYDEALKIIKKYYPCQVIGKVVEDRKEKVKLKTFQGNWIEL